MTSAIANPRNARLIDVHRIDQDLAVVDGRGEARPTRRVGAGTLYSSVIADAQMTCQTAMNAAAPRAAAARPRVRAATRAWRGRRGVERVESRDGAAASSRRGGFRSVMSVSERPATGSGHAAWLVMTCRSRAVISVCRSLCSSVGPVARRRHSRDDGARARREQHDPLGELDRLAHVVGDEQDRGAGGLPDAQQLALQHVAGDRVQRRERLVHQQHPGRPRPRRRPSSRPAHGPATRAGACRPTARAAACRPARRGAPATAAPRPAAGAPGGPGPRAAGAARRCAAR